MQVKAATNIRISIHERSNQLAKQKPNNRPIINLRWSLLATCLLHVKMAASSASGSSTHKPQSQVWKFFEKASDKSVSCRIYIWPFMVVPALLKST